MIKRTTFVLDAFPNRYYHGFSEDQTTWNGFACPLFPLAEALRLTVQNNATDYCGHLEYDANQDLFRFADDASQVANEATEFKAVRIGDSTFYGIGAFGWSWSHVEDATSTFSADLHLELSEMKRLGVVVPDRAFDLVCEREWVDEQLNMRTSDAADLAIQLAEVI